MPDVPSFFEFYAAVHRGREPFPWQRRLADIVEAETWPDEIGVPTGLGKTACLDVAVWALARQADRNPHTRTAPTRIWYVVNRRLLVDAALEQGKKLERWLGLATPESAPRLLESLRTDWPDAGQHQVDIIRSVADALRTIAALGSERGPLHVARLRGGADLGQRAPDPSMPTLLFATVPMFASRWLFRGYGSSASMRPVDAALAGIDSLVLLDEAHLARPLARLSGPLAGCDVGDPALVVPPPRARPRFVALTATGEGQGPRFDLDDEDRVHQVIQQRLHATKRTALRTSIRKALVSDLATAALEAVRGASRPTSCLLFANTPATARAAFDLVRKEIDAKELAVEPMLLTGRMREREAAVVGQRLLDPHDGVPSGRDRSQPRQRHLLVVATQTLEVGADIDVDHLVTETAGVRSMIQRFGRLNRLGDLPDATATVVHAEDVEQWPVYGTEPADVWRSLQEAVGRGDSSLGPEQIADVLGETADEPPATPELLPHHVWDWAKTSVPRDDIVPPELFFDESDDRAMVSVIWRAYVPKRRGADGKDEVIDGAELVPPISGKEAVDVPWADLQEALQKGGVADAVRLGRDLRTLERVPIGRLRPSDQVVLESSVGMYDDFGWAPDHRGAVPDVSLLRLGLVLRPDVLRALFGEPRSEGATADEESGDSPWAVVDRAVRNLRDDPDSASDADDQAELAAQRAEDLAVVIATLGSAGPPVWLDDRNETETDDWRNWWGDIQDAGDGGPGRLDWLADGTPFIQRRALKRRAAWVGVRSDAFDDLSFLGLDATEPGLRDHLGTVGELAARIARQIGCRPEVVAVVQEAGATHDLGKLEPRFQRWLNPEPGEGVVEPEPLAKSVTPWQERERTRVRAGWPQGGRHELLSVRVLAEVVDADDPVRDLLLHLVISHHGHGRPTVGVADDPEPTKFRATVPGRGEVTVVGDLSTADWDQPARFRRACEHYGYWGLALLEAIVRQADHAASAAAVEVA